MAMSSPERVPRTADDWNALWRAKQAARAGAHDAAYWDKRAKTYTSKDNPGSYTTRFLKLAQIEPEDTIFDMGCGTGNLTIPLARAGHHVVAADFSEGMLSQLKSAVAEEGLHERVSVMQLSWDDDWKAAGLCEGQFDVCIASRSIATENLLGALRKLTSVAKRRACITLPCGTSPRTDDAMLRAIGFDVQPSYDSTYAIALLSALGQLPCLDYIPTLRNDRFDTKDEAFERYYRMALDHAHHTSTPPSTQELEARVHAWINTSVVPCADDPTAFELATPRESFWAFISWDKRSNA